MRAAVLAALAVCAAEGTTPDVRYMFDHDSVSSSYSTPQVWAISCEPGSTLSFNATYTPSGYTLTFGGKSVHAGSNQRVTCPYDKTLTLDYTSSDGDHHSVSVSWRRLDIPIPDTPAPPLSPAVVHPMADHDSVSAHYYKNPQEWVISCTPGSPLVMDIAFTPSGYNLTLDGEPLFSEYRHVICPSSGKMSLLFTPYDGYSHHLSIEWYPTTAAPTPSPETPEPTLSPVTVHYMTDRHWVYTSSSTPQEWVIPCTPGSTLSMDITTDPPLSGYILAFNDTLMHSGERQHVTCPSSGEPSMIYTPYDGQSHSLSFIWLTLHPTVHRVSDHESITYFYSTPQEWLITCTPYSYVDVNVTQLPGTLTADTMTMHQGKTSVYNAAVTTTLHQGQRKVDCPPTGQVKLMYIPSSGTSQPLIVSWDAEGAEEWEDELHTRSQLLRLVILGVLVLVGVTFAAYKRCFLPAVPRADSSNVQREGYTDAGPTGGFGGLQDSPSPPEGQQPVTEMEEQQLVVVVDSSSSPEGQQPVSEMEQQLLLVE